MTYLQRKKRAFMSVIQKAKGFIRTISGVPPLTLPYCVDNESLIDYSITGAIGGVGDLVDTEYIIPVVASGKNVIDITQIKGNAASTRKVEDNVITVTQTANNAYFYIAFPVKANTDYTFRFRFNRTMSGTSALFGLGYTSSPDTMYIAGHNTAWNNYDDRLGEDCYWTTTVNSGSYTKLFFKGYVSYGAVGCILKMWDIQMEEGKTPLEYEAYIEPITTNILLATPLGEGEIISYKKDNLPTLPTFKGTTIYTVGTTVQPTNMEVSYYRTITEG